MRLCRTEMVIHPWRIYIAGYSETNLWDIKKKRKKRFEHKKIKMHRSSFFFIELSRWFVSFFFILFFPLFFQDYSKSFLPISLLWFHSQFDAQKKKFFFLKVMMKKLKILFLASRFSNMSRFHTKNWNGNQIIKP